MTITLDEAERRLKSGKWLYVPELGWIDKSDGELMTAYASYCENHAAFRRAERDVERDVQADLATLARLTGDSTERVYDRRLSERNYWEAFADEFDARVRAAKSELAARRSEHKLAPFAFTEVKSAGGGVFSGYLSTFGNEDRAGDIVEAGAYSKTLKEIAAKPYSKRALLPLLFMHDRSAPIGGFTALTEDKVGLRFTAFINEETALGHDVMSNIRAGALSGMSIGFTPIKFDYDRKQIRHLREIRLSEGSVVTLAANPEARID